MVHTGSGDLTFGGFWKEKLLSINVNIKEMLSIANPLESLPAGESRLSRRYSRGQPGGYVYLARWRVSF